MEQSKIESSILYQNISTTGRYLALSSLLYLAVTLLLCEPTRSESALSALETLGRAELVICDRMEPTRFDRQLLLPKLESDVTVENWWNKVEAILTDPNSQLHGGNPNSPQLNTHRMSNMAMLLASGIGRITWAQILRPSASRKVRQILEWLPRFVAMTASSQYHVVGIRSTPPKVPGPNGSLISPATFEQDSGQYAEISVISEDMGNAHIRVLGLGMYDEQSKIEVQDSPMCKVYLSREQADSLLRETIGLTNESISLFRASTDGQPADHFPQFSSLLHQEQIMDLELKEAIGWVKSQIESEKLAKSEIAGLEINLPLERLKTYLLLIAIGFLALHIICCITVYQIERTEQDKHPGLGFWLLIVGNLALGLVLVALYSLAPGPSPNIFGLACAISLIVILEAINLFPFHFIQLCARYSMATEREGEAGRQTCNLS